MAASLAYAIALVCLNGSERAKQIIYSHRQVPSVNFAYHRMRQLECKTNRKCACGRNCDGVCDKYCGGFVTIGLDVFEIGVPPASFWPEDKPDDRRLVHRLRDHPFLEASYVFRLRESRGLPNTADAVLQALKASQPVVINMKVFYKQKAFFEHSSKAPPFESNSRSPPFESSHPHFAKNLSVYSPAFRLPPPDNEGPSHHMGHCVLIIGYSEEAQAFHVRNSFGVEWGYYGDFSFPFAMFNDSQVYQTVAIVEGDVKELDR